jgi:hypothetical protein
VIAFDYGFLGDRDEDESRSSPILVTKCDGDRWVDADLLPSKGLVHKHNVKTLVENVRKSGFAKCILKCDNEPAILALRAEAAKILSRDFGKQILDENPAKGESQSNGMAENAVKEMKGVVRSQKHLAEELHGKAIGPHHVVLPFLVHHAGSMISRAQRGLDGRTAFELRRGKPYRKPLPSITEAVMYLPTGKRVSTLRDRWLVGLFLGVQDCSDEVVIGTEHGIFKARSIKRMEPTLRGNAALLDKIKGSPWDWVQGVSWRTSRTSSFALWRIESYQRRIYHPL